MDLTEFVLAIALSSTMAAIVTVVLSYFVQERRFKHESEARYLRAKVRLYSLILFHLTAMRLHNIVLGGSGESYSWGKRHPLEEIIREIDTAIKPRLDLLNPEALRNYLEAQPMLYTREALTLGDGISSLATFHDLVLREYNEELIPAYRKIVGPEPRKLEYKPEPPLPQQQHTK
jgi:hypothetical protein